jgi:hypothetical protein
MKFLGGDPKTAGRQHGGDYTSVNVYSPDVRLGATVCGAIVSGNFGALEDKGGHKWEDTPSL